jgi:biliverdin reductase
MVGVGIVGTGFVATKRADALANDSRGRLAAVAGYSYDETVAFAQKYGAMPVQQWTDLLTVADVDLIMVCHVNRDHGFVAEAALAAGKSVVVEYPLALTPDHAEQVINLARRQRQLLHVAHVELLAGNHQALREHLPKLGAVHYARYCTFAPKRSRLNHWTYNPSLFGFPLVGAQSRLHRLIDCFGRVKQVYCQNRYVQLETRNGEASHRGCICTAQLTFSSGVVGEVTYGKGEAIWASTRRLEVFGEKGSLVLAGDQGKWLSSQENSSIVLPSRQGLFCQDTRRVLDHWLDHKPLYCSAEESLYSLRVAAAAEQSATLGEAVTIS